MYYESLEETCNKYFGKWMDGSQIHEYGCCTGNGIRCMLSACREKDISNVRMIGFDSLVGLPKEKDGIWCNPDWPEGAFNSMEYFGVKTKQEAAEKILEKSLNLGYKIDLVDGWYKDTLNKLTIEKYNIGSPSFIHLDTDIYISALEVLEFLCFNDLWSKETIIRYDDWASTPEWTAGESLAHKEMCEKYGVTFDRLNQNVFRFTS